MTNRKPGPRVFSTPSTPQAADPFGDHYRKIAAAKHGAWAVHYYAGAQRHD